MQPRVQSKAMICHVAKFISPSKMPASQKWLILSLCCKLYLYPHSFLFLLRQDPGGIPVNQLTSQKLYFSFRLPMNSNVENYNSKVTGKYVLYQYMYQQC